MFSILVKKMKKIDNHLGLSRKVLQAISYRFLLLAYTETDLNE